MVSSLSPTLNGYYSNLYSAGSAASALLSAAQSNSDSAVVGVDSSVIAAYYQAKAGVIAPSAGVAATAPTYATAAPTTSGLTNAVLSGGAFVDPASVKLTATASTPSQTSDYRNLFALYQGLTALQGLATQATTSTASTQPNLASTFARGLSEVQSFLDTQPYQNLTVADGSVGVVAQSSVAIPLPSNTYTTTTLNSGGSNDVPAAFSGDVQFSATVASLTGTKKTVTFDLADLGSTPRTIGAVAAYFNTRLQAAGVATRFASVRTPGTPDTVPAGGETITLGQNPDTFALQVTTGAGESVAFAAPTTRPAVYLAQTLGVTAAALAASVSNSTASDQVSTPDATQQVLKFDASSPAGAGATTKATLAASVSNVAAQVVGSDGSRYVLANLSGASPDGQPIKGVLDAALLKYDSAGTLLYTRTLGSADAASGSALALSADGKEVAVVGSVVGPLNGATSSTLIAPQQSVSTPPSQSFASVYDTAAGAELWTETTGAAGESTATAAAFAPDGTLYVTGDTTASPGQTDPNLQRGYLQSFKATAATAADGSTNQHVVASDVVSTGPAPGDPSAGVVVTADGGVVAAVVQHGDLVLQRYDGPLAAGTQPSATRDLGDLNGGSVAGVALTSDGSVVVAGSTSNGALAPGAATNGGSGGQQAFVATVSANLAPGAGDRVTYLAKGAGDATATALTVSGDEIYVAGSVESGVTPSSRGAKATTGFAIAIDAATGATGWSTTLTGTDDQAAPSAIAVSATGSSILDRLGLPQGTLGLAPSSTLVANTSLRAGDQFSVRSGAGAAHAVIITADDTLATLASKINSALGYAGSATLVPTTSGDGSELKILATTTNSLELESGPVGADALGALGLTAGLVTPAATGSGAASRATPLALNLSASLDISTTAAATAAQTVLTAALATIQSAYTNLGAPKTSSAAATATGPVPSYITAQIADYQLALSRLTGG